MMKSSSLGYYFKRYYKYLILLVSLCAIAVLSWYVFSRYTVSTHALFMKPSDLKVVNRHFQTLLKTNCSLVEFECAPFGHDKVKARIFIEQSNDNQVNEQLRHMNLTYNNLTHNILFFRQQYADKKALDDFFKTLDPDLSFEAISDVCSPKTNHPSVERTYAMIKPLAVSEKFTNAIVESILDKHFKIVALKKYHLDQASAAEFYKEHKGKPFFNDLVNMMSSGPIIAMVLEKKNAVADWRALMGPTNPKTARQTDPSLLRARFGQDLTNNAVHGSASVPEALHEIEFFCSYIWPK